jgi:hypothetical protein
VTYINPIRISLAGQSESKGLIQMTNHRSPYHEFLGKRLLHQSTVSPLTQHHTDGSTSYDTVLLLPILSSEHRTDQPFPCLHHVSLPDGLLGLCNMKTEHRCPCCGNAMCYEHQSERSVSLPDETAGWQEDAPTFLCVTCAHFPLDMIYALYTFRHTLNEQKEQAQQ